MRTPVYLLSSFALALAALRAGAQPPAARPAGEFAPLVLTDPFTELDKQGEEGGNGKGEKKEPPKHIRDNGFLVEEASNQEPGVVQHIFNWVNFWKRAPDGRSRDFIFSYTPEFPLGSQTHQFSFTALFLTEHEKLNNAPFSQQGDIGDTFLNYRYQLLADDDFLWAAPRFTLILPTGDRRLGLGLGEVGYQFNLPVSRYGEDFDFHFNAGFTYAPNVAAVLADATETEAERLSPRHNLRLWNLGAAAYWKPKTYLHFFVETLALWFDEIDDDGFRQSQTQVFVNPGVRWAVIQGPVEWVLGASVPIGLTRDTPDIGVFAYMSIEFGFRKGM